MLWSGNHVGHGSRSTNLFTFPRTSALLGLVKSARGASWDKFGSGRSITVAEDNFIGAGAVVNRNTVENSITQEILQYGTNECLRPNILRLSLSNTSWEAQILVEFPNFWVFSGFRIASTLRSSLLRYGCKASVEDIFSTGAITGF